MSASLASVLLLGLLVAPALGQSAASPGNWQPGPGASGANTYLGRIDAPASGFTAPTNGLMIVKGWFVDATAQGWSGADRIQVFLGTPDSGMLLADASLGLSRPDLAGVVSASAWASAGWSATVDSASLAPGTTSLSVAAHTPDKGSWFSQVSINVGASSPAAAAAAGSSLAGAGPFVATPPPVITVAEPFDGERVSNRLGNLRIHGMVRDPTGGPRAIDWVELWLDGEQNSANAYFIGVADLASDGSWTIDFLPASYPAILSNLYVYAHSGLSGRTGLTLVHFEIIDRPLTSGAGAPGGL